MDRKNFLQKRWYHATTLVNWKKIKKDGVLWGRPKGEPRHTYLAHDKLDILGRTSTRFSLAGVLCEVLLSVKYTPDSLSDDYAPKSWELIVRRPIPIQDVKVLRYYKPKKKENTNE
jgi:hypothetical protein